MVAHQCDARPIVGDDDAHPVAGRAVDLRALADAVEARIAGDNFGVGICIDEKAPTAEPELSPAP